MPRTGIAKADRVMSRYMAIQAERMIPVILQQKWYQNLASNEAKQEVLMKAFQEIKANAKKQMAISNPKLSLQVYYESLGVRRKKIISGE